MKLLLLYFSCCFFTLDSFAQKKAIIVSQDGTGDFKTVQAAFDFIPTNNKSPLIIFVRQGIYKEKLHLDSGKHFITLKGEDENRTILVFDDHSGKRTASGEIINTYTSASFVIRGNDFRAENITFQNNAGFNAGQAVALQVIGDRCVFIACRMLGFQDTLFTTAENSRQLYKNCYIEGTTDFIFGASTALFEGCHIHSKKNSHVTAASTPQLHAYGYVFKNCRLTADTGINFVTLGRPWRPYASVTYIRCYLGDHIIPAGWDNWRNPENEKTARYAEYRNYGPGAKPEARVSWSKQLTRKEANQITRRAMFGDWKPAGRKRVVPPLLVPPLLVPPLLVPPL